MFKKHLAKLSNRHFLSLTGNGVMAVLSVLTYGILYRLLSEVEMGKWVFFQFAFILIDTFRTGFLQTALIKFFSGVGAGRAENITGSVWVLAFYITGTFVLIDILGLSIMKSIDNDSLALFITWSGMAFLFTLPFNVALWILQAKQKFDKILYIRLINQGSFILIIIVYYLLSDRRLTLQMVLYSYIFSSLLVSIISLLTGWSAIRTIASYTGDCIKEIFHFGKFSVGTVVSSSLLKSSDTFIINFMLGPAALAIYNLPQRLMEIIEIPMRSIAATAMPVMSIAANKNDKNAVIIILKRYAGTLTMLLIPIAIISIIMSNVVVGLIGGGKYVHTEAANIFRILMLYAVFTPIDRFAGITLDIIYKPQLNLIKVLLTLSINIITDVIGIHLFHNIYGPAWASVFTFCIAIFYGYAMLRRYLNFTIGGILKVGYSETLSHMQHLFYKPKTIKA